MSRAPATMFLLAVLPISAVMLAAPAAGAPQAQPSEPLAARAEQPGTATLTAGRRVAVADPDLDGEVTRTEAAGYYESRFRLIDGNRDGWIDSPEFLRAVEGRAWPAGGPISKPRPVGFKALDVDGSGQLTREELVRAARLQSLSSDRRAGPPRQAVFEATDGNRDGELSRQEFIDAGGREFDRSDPDGDGKVSIWQFYGGTSL
jgi:Ca2+-binding EF-hand superfamily protein